MQVNETTRPDWWPERLEAIARLGGWAEGREPPAWPMEVFLEVSNLCDLKCAMCPTFSALNPSRLYSIKEQERGFLDLAALKDRLDAVLKRAIRVHCYGYGEPTIHPGFVDLLDDLGEYRVLIDFFTNGMHLDAALCEQLVARKVFSVTVSFSGSDRESYENIYLGGRFQTVLDGLRRLRDAKLASASLYPRIEINSIAFDHQVRGLPEFVDLMADAGVAVIYLKTLQTFSTIQELRGHRSVMRPWIEGDMLRAAQARAKARGLILSTEQYRQTEVPDETAWRSARGDTSATVPLNLIGETARRATPVRPPPEHVSSVQVDAMRLAPDALRDAFALEDYAGATPFNCLEPFQTLYVRRSGNVKPCCFADDSGPALGNLIERDAADIWNGLPWRTLRESILAQRYPRALCGHCLKVQYGPRQQAIPDHLEQYRIWLQDVWGDALPVALPSQTISNQELAQRWLNARDLARQRTRLLDEVRRLTPFRVPRTLLEGHLDGLRGDELHGWLYAPDSPEVRLSVTIHLDGQPWKTLPADRFRDDLRLAGKGDGAYGFMVDLADAPPSRLLEVRLAETDWLLGRIDFTSDNTSAQAQAVRSNETAPQPSFTEPAPFLLDYSPGIHEQEIFRYFARHSAGRPQPAPPRPDELPHTVLVIAFANRSGSNLLAETLAATGLVERARERFNFDLLSETCQREGIADLAGYLGYLQRSGSDGRVLAVKLDWGQLFFLTRVGVIPHYWPRVRFVWSLRNDLLAQAMSHLVAERTGCWSAPYPEAVLETFLDELQPIDLARKVEEITFAHRQLMSYFALYGIEPAIVDYDDLAADPEQTARRVLTELQLIPPDGRWRFDPRQIAVRRQRTAGMERALARLKQAIRAYR